MSTIIDCPSCTRKLNVPEEMLGRPVRCPDCGGMFAAGTEGVLPPPPEEPTDETEPPSVPQPAPPAAVTASVPVPSAPSSAGDSSLRPCPHCGRQLPTAAVHCQHCGEDLAEEIDRPWEGRYRPIVRRDCEPHRGVVVLVLGILSLVLGALGLPLGIAAWIMGTRDMKKMTERSMDPEGRGLTQAGRICGVVGTIVSGLLLLFFVGYFVFIFAVLIPMTRSAAVGPVPAPAVAPAAPKPVPVAPPKEQAPPAPQQQ
jgi:hypothetical protein